MKLEDLRKIRERASKDLNLRKGDARVRIVVGMGTSGIAAGARDVLAAFLDEIAKRDLTDVVVTQTGGRGLASSEPVVEIHVREKPIVVYGNVDRDRVGRIITEHVVNGQAIEEFVIEVREP